MQKQRNEPRADALAGKAATGNPEASAAAKKAKDALTKLDEQPSNPLLKFPPMRQTDQWRQEPDGTRTNIGFGSVWNRHDLIRWGFDVDGELRKARVHRNGGLCCYCGDWNCDIGDFIWRN